MTDETRDALPETDDVSSDVDRDHLSDLDDGAGCTEIWEHLTEYRKNRGE